MSLLFETAASLHVLGDELDPTEITALPGKQPDLSEHRGDVVTMRSGRTRVARRGHWRVRAEYKRPGDLDDQVTVL